MFRRRWIIVVGWLLALGASMGAGSSIAQTSATVRRVIDGDTLKLDIRAGTLLIASEAMTVMLEDKSVRVLGINAHEAKTEAGRAARANLVELLPVGSAVTLAAIGDYKFGGGLVARVTLPDGRDLATVLIADNWAAPWDGKGARPLPPWPRP